MDDAERAKVNHQCTAVRAELKTWEKEFALTNDGRKASREDIKADPAIGKRVYAFFSPNLQLSAKKYKEYSKLRDVLEGKVQPKPQREISTTPKKRRAAYDDTSEKRQRIRHGPTETPTSGISHKPWQIDPYDSPSLVRKLFTPSRRSFIGPTPQKDGQVLGIFDAISQEDVALCNTPSRTKPAPSSTIIASTPGKSLASPELFKHSRTPISSSKRRMLDLLATPSRARRTSTDNHTPSTVSKMTTPSFLKRDSQRWDLHAVNEHNDLTSPKMARGPRKPFGRALSNMLASLRDMEDEAADDDLDALREIENEAMAIAPPHKPLPPKQQGPSILEGPSIAEMPKLLAPSALPLGGFDDPAMLDTDDEEAQSQRAREGQPTKVWKKKGQKRTTRLVRMKPSKVAPLPAVADDSSADEHALPIEPHTQDLQRSTDDPAVLDTTTADARNFDSDTGTEYTASEGGTRYPRPRQERKNRAVNSDGRVKTQARRSKVTALKNQNFQRLKIRSSKGSKAGNGGRGRWGKRR